MTYEEIEVIEIAYEYAGVDLGEVQARMDEVKSDKRLTGAEKRAEIVDIFHETVGQIVYAVEMYKLDDAHPLDTGDIVDFFAERLEMDI